MGVASGCGEQEAGVASGSGWNLWVWLLGVVVRRYIDFFIPTPLVSVLFCSSSIPTFCSFFKMFLLLLVMLYVVTIYGAMLSKYLMNTTCYFLPCRKCSKCFYMYVYLNIRPM